MVSQDILVARLRGSVFLYQCLKPNAREIKSFHDADPESYPNTGADYDPVFMKVIPCASVVFVTYGEHGISVWNANNSGALTSVQAYPVSGPIDICGAGDSCSAGITSAMVSGATHEEAAAFGNLIASITIQQIGVTGTATPEQVRARWREVQ